MRGPYGTPIYFVDLRPFPRDLDFDNVYFLWRLPICIKETVIMGVYTGYTDLKGNNSRYLI